MQRNPLSLWSSSHDRSSTSISSLNSKCSLTCFGMSYYTFSRQLWRLTESHQMPQWSVVNVDQFQLIGPPGSFFFKANPFDLLVYWPPSPVSLQTHKDGQRLPIPGRYSSWCILTGQLFPSITGRQKAEWLSLQAVIHICIDSIAFWNNHPANEILGFLNGFTQRPQVNIRSVSSEPDSQHPWVAIHSIS